MTNLAAALLAFQSNAPELHTDASNSHFNNKYLSLVGLMRAILPALNANGLVLMQFPSSLEGQPALRTKLIHAKSGEFEEDVMPLVLAKNDPQAQGSGLTYARRYAALSILGLVADEDDDGNAATRSVGEPRAVQGTGRTPVQAPVTQAASEPASPTESPFQPPPPREAPDDGDPKNVAVHFGKNAGKKLGDMTRNQVKWYAENELRPDATAADRRLKAAAMTILETTGGRG